MAKKKNLSAKAIRLLRRVEKHILAEPKRYDQGSWGKRDSESPCGTKACIAGWIDVLSRGPATKANLAAFHRRSGTSILRSALAALGFDYDSHNSDRIAYSLFGLASQDWPQPFQQRWLAADSQQQRARIAADRIEHFIKTDGAE